MMGDGLFVTGTDTAVGKTLVTGGLAACLAEDGFAVGVMKPAETGCRPSKGSRIARDAGFLKQMSGTATPVEQIVPYRLLAPLAPQAAAHLEKVRIRVPHIERLYRRISSQHDITLVEGAGGLLVPYTSRQRTLEIILRLGIPVLLVCRTGLGTLNHTLLTLDCLLRNRVPVAGIVLNNAQGSRGLADRTNPSMLARWTKAPILGRIPYSPGLRMSRGSKARVAGLVRRHVDLDRLVERVAG